MAEEELKARARALLDLCRSKRLKLAAAESCTGGLLAATLTEIPGSSDVFERGFITYCNEAKETMLGVPTATLKSHGAVSRETAAAMARGVLAHAPVERTLQLFNQVLQIGAVKREVAGNGLAYEGVGERHVGDEELGAVRVREPLAELERAAQRYEFWIARHVGHQVEHVSRGVAN